MFAVTFGFLSVNSLSCSSSRVLLKVSSFQLLKTSSTLLPLAGFAAAAGAAAVALAGAVVGAAAGFVAAAAGAVVGAAAAAGFAPGLCAPCASVGFAGARALVRVGGGGCLQAPRRLSS